MVGCETSESKTAAPENGVIRVALVEDRELVRSGVCNALGMSPQMQVVGEAGDGVAALALLGSREVNVLLLDLHMPRLLVRQVAGGAERPVR